MPCDAWFQRPTGIKSEKLLIILPAVTRQRPTLALGRATGDWERGCLAVTVDWTAWDLVHMWGPVNSSLLAMAWRV